MTKTEEKIIKLLADYPEREFYAQEIARIVKCSKASASGILKLLTKKKIAFRKVRGHMKFYQINQRSPRVKKLKIDWVLEKINSLLPKLEKFSKKIILFGSASRGEQTHDSDIDLFIISDDKDNIRAALNKISRELRVKAIVKTAGEWSEMEIKEPEFYREIKSGITLYEYVPRI
jgi:predicted nucleotidyltransferase